MKHFFSRMRGWPAALSMLLGLAGPAARAQAPAWAQLSTGQPVSATGYSFVQASTSADADGNVYVAGNFSGTVRFGTAVLTSDNSRSQAASDGFVAKWSSTTGTFVWAVALGGNAGDQATNLAVANGAVYVAGSFSSPTAAFGPFILLNTASTGGSDIFVARLIDAGASATFGWVQAAGGPGSDTATGLAVSGNSLYLAGMYSGATIAIGGTVLTNVNAPSVTTDTFVAKLTEAGSGAAFGWALGFGGSGSDAVRNLAVGSGGLYATGDFTSPSLPMGATVLANAAGSAAPTTADVLVAKLADAGPTASVVWAQRLGGSAHDTGDALALSGSALYIAGSFSGPSSTFGPVTLPSTNLSSDVFVAKLTDTGPGATVAWAQGAGGAGPDQARSLAVRGPHVFVAGSYGYPSATFGSTVLTNRGSGSGAGFDIFVARLTEGSTGVAFAWAQSAGGVAGETASGVGLAGGLVVVAGAAAPQAAFGALLAPPNTTTAAFVATLADPTLTAGAARSTLHFALFPNPARATATVQLPAVPGAPTATLTLTDALGRVVRNAAAVLPAVGLRHPLDLRGLAPGLYTVQVRAGSISGTQRLVVE